METDHVIGELAEGHCPAFIRKSALSGELVLTVT